jgi:hypothetical protein
VRASECLTGTGPWWALALPPLVFVLGGIGPGSATRLCRLQTRPSRFKFRALIRSKDVFSAFFG